MKPKQQRKLTPECQERELRARLEQQEPKQQREQGSGLGQQELKPTGELSEHQQWEQESEQRVAMRSTPDRLREEELREMLERLHDRYNAVDFIEWDPISVPHGFSTREDIEISGFLAATIAWGNRKSIVKNARHLMTLMDNAPHDFIVNATKNDMNVLAGYVHRTFNGSDCCDFVRSLRRFYTQHGGLGVFFETEYLAASDIRVVLSAFRKEFWLCDHQPRAEKHISSIDKGSACKRLNMYIKWMVRRDNRGVDFGLWQTIPPAAIYLPLDVHTANMGRALGLLSRRQNDWKAVEEITAALRGFDPSDPVKYDFALFGAGIDGFLK